VNLLDETSLAGTVDAVNAAFFFGEDVPQEERKRTARWIADRQGLEGSYRGVMFAPTDKDMADGMRIFTGRKVGSGGGARHVIGEEACRVLRLLEVHDDGVGGALERATAYMAAQIKGDALARGMFCCGRCTPSVWRHILVGGLAEGPAADFMHAGLRTLKKYRLETGKWRFFPFHYTLLALSEMDLPAAVAEMRHAAPACERVLERKPKNEYDRRRHTVAERVLAKC
jgi:hypothetical protein